jgi:hypothetical protein
MMRDTQLRLDKCNEDDGDVVVMQYDSEGIVTQLSMEMQDVRTQHKDLDRVKDNEGDLVGLRGTPNLNLKWGSGGLLLVLKINKAQVFMLRNLKLKRKEQRKQ